MTTQYEEFQFKLLDHLHTVALDLTDHVAQQAIKDAVNAARVRAWERARNALAAPQS